jgi:imidazolonepropionase-like amidohydrolase
MIKRLLLAGAIAAFAAAPALAQVTAITNARIISLGPAGDVVGGTVLVRDGKIAAVGKSVQIPSGAHVIDAKGQFLTPGLMMAPTPLALKDIIGNGGGRGSTQENLSAAYEVADDFNPRHPHIAEARIEGVTRALLTADAPRKEGKLFAGQAALVQLGEQGVEHGMVTNPHAAIFMSATEGGSATAGGGSGALRVRLKQVLADAREYQKNPKGFDAAKLEEGKLSRADMAALGPVVAGREPLLIEVNRAQEILNVLKIAREENVKVVLSGVTEGWLVAKELAAAKVPVIVDGEVNQAMGMEDINATYENAALLTKAGVMVAFKPTFSRIVILDRSPRWTAGRAARYGLRLHDALAAITLNPAKMFGLGDRYGSIETGKDADLVIWSGDPLETTTVARMVMIEGVEQPMTARNRELRDRYLPMVTAGR